MTRFLLFCSLLLSLTATSAEQALAFSNLPDCPRRSNGFVPRQQNNGARTKLRMAQVTEQEARKGIDRVVAALRRDAAAKAELGKLDKVTVVLGYGSPNGTSLNVRFNASFKKGGMGLSSVPLPFGLGQSNKSEGRGAMVGQVKASVDVETGKVTSCSVFRDLGYGRAFNLKV